MLSTVVFFEPVFKFLISDSISLAPVPKFDEGMWHLDGLVEIWLDLGGIGGFEASPGVLL